MRTASFFPELVREFLHQFMTTLAKKIGQWLGPLHAVFASGQWLGLCCHMSTPFVFARLTLKTSISIDLTDRLQGAAFSLLFPGGRAARLAMKLRAPEAGCARSRLRRVGID